MQRPYPWVLEEQQEGRAVRGEWAGGERKEKTMKDSGSDDAGPYNYEGNRKLLGGFQHGSNTFWFTFLKTTLGTSLVVQWLRICLPMQGTQVRALVREDPTCHGATKPMRHNYWPREPQLLKPAHLEPMLCNKRSHHNEKPAQCSEE